MNGQCFSTCLLYKLTVNGNLQKFCLLLMQLQHSLLLLSALEAATATFIHLAQQPPKLELLLLLRQLGLELLELELQLKRVLVHIGVLLLLLELLEELELLVLLQHALLLLQHALLLQQQLLPVFVGSLTIIPCAL